MLRKTRSTILIAATIGVLYAGAICTEGAEAPASAEFPVLLVPDRKPIGSDPFGLVGRWRRVRVEIEGVPQPATEIHWVITDQSITVSVGFDPHVVETWRFRINTAGNPAELDLYFVGGRQEHRPCIFKLEGDRLTICLQNFASRGRPKDFNSKTLSGAATLVFERIK